MLSLQWLRSLLWHGFDPWPGNFCMSQEQPKEGRKERRKEGKKERERRREGGKEGKEEGRKKGRKEMELSEGKIPFFCETFV